MAPKIKLVYFNIRGRGELIRLTLHAGGVPFIDERVDFQDWPSRREECPNGKLPYIEVAGKMFGETLPIVRFVGAKCNLLGKTDEEKLYVDIVLTQVEHLRDDVSRPKTDTLLTKGQRKCLEDKLRSETVPRFLQKIEAGVSMGKTGYVLGSEMTVADLAVWDAVDSLLVSYPNLLDNHPKVLEHRQRIMGLPKIRKYLETRPQTKL
ncbi:glutathione S-transferase class-mu 28 kDa isozyme [Aplysia californica]|uniref:Glutathione S-transferase class-mu 28 kDa isozyme n=1 Tax=Aplysia californica TaxID=6500 RepID=A0ABM0JGF2_APLCA|nr:glutathione S-transferase class-mu 28 kDa isozyme [Aplysia californica]